MLNRIDIQGRLVRDPELRRTQSGVAVTSFTLAVERDYCEAGKDREADFIDCVAWRGTAEFIDKYFTKGRMMIVTGRLQIRNWQDKEGNKRRSAEVVADNVYFGESKRRDDGGAPRQEYAPRTPSNEGFDSAKAQAGSFQTIDDDDGQLPF